MNLRGITLKKLKIKKINRNDEGRADKVPAKAILSKAKELERPSYAEGFDMLYYVKIAEEFDWSEGEFWPFLDFCKSKNLKYTEDSYWD